MISLTPRTGRLLAALAALAWLLSLPAPALAHRARPRSGRSCPSRHARRACTPVPLGLRGARIGTAGALSAEVIQTTADLRQALTVLPSEAFTAAPEPGAAVLQVSDQTRYQRIIGFGAAMTDSSAWLLRDQLTPQARAATFERLFGAAGIHLDYVRIPIAASDYTVSPAPYSYDDMPAGQTDATLARFSIAHDQPYVIPALKEMLAVDPRVFTLANPWSAPPWMKANQAFDSFGPNGTVLAQYYPALAQYFVRFIQAYQAEGVPIDAITPMNEPNSRSVWPGTALTPADDAVFIPQNLQPALAAAGLHPTIFGNDDTELADAQALLGGPAGPDLGGIAFHCYQGLGQMSALHAEYPNEAIIVNECSPGIIPYATAEVGIDATRNWASGVQLWNLALDENRGPYEGARSYGCPGCTGLVTVNQSTHQARLNHNYYQFGQISRYVEPGAVRIFSTRLVSDGFGISPGLDDVAFENPDGSKVLVAYNNSFGAETFAVAWRGRYLTHTLAPAATVTLRWR